jgi:hypothetical protein
MSDTVTSRIAALRDRGVVIVNKYEYVGMPGTPERHQVDIPGTVECVDLPLKPAEWLSVAMREGAYYMGGCCGNMSHLQDIVNEAFRNSGTVAGRELASIGELIRRHGDLENFEPLDDALFAELMTEWDEGKLGPWDKISVLYVALEPALKIDSFEAPQARIVRNPMEASIDQLGGALQYLSFSEIFEPEADILKPTHAANRLVKLAQILEPTRLLLGLLEASDVRFEGVALVQPDTGVIAENNYGLCLFSTVEAARHIRELTEQSYPDNPRLVVQAVTVTVADGLQLGDVVSE